MSTTKSRASQFLSRGSRAGRPGAPGTPAVREFHVGAWAWGGALVGGLLALVLSAPANWLASALAQASSQHLLLSEPRGSVWQGSARLVLTGGEGSQDKAALPGRVQWTIRPSFSGLRLALVADCCTSGPLQLLVRPSIGAFRLELADAASQWPASILAGLGTPWNTLQPTGQLELQSRALSAEWNAGRLSVTGSAVLQARDVSSRLSTLRPMGSYRLQLQGGPSVNLVLDTLEGSLQLVGTGQWVGGRLRFTGEASAAPDREAALSNFLNIIGRRSGLRSVITLG